MHNIDEGELHGKHPIWMKWCIENVRTRVS